MCQFCDIPLLYAINVCNGLMSLITNGRCLKCIDARACDESYPELAFSIEYIVLRSSGFKTKRTDYKTASQRLDSTLRPTTID
jgi:hypothetical protein